MSCRNLLPFGPFPRNEASELLKINLVKPRESRNDVNSRAFDDAWTSWWIARRCFSCHGLARMGFYERTRAKGHDQVRGRLGEGAIVSVSSDSVIAHLCCMSRVNANRLSSQEGLMSMGVLATSQVFTGCERCGESEGRSAGAGHHCMVVKHKALHGMHSSRFDSWSGQPACTD